MITLTLTEDQADYIAKAVSNDLEVKRDNANKQGMGLDPKFEAFNKRLTSKLIKTLINNDAHQFMKKHPLI